MGILQCDFDHESKRKCRKVSNFGWVAFVFTAVSYWHDYRQFKRKKITWRIKWKIQMTEGPIIRIVLKETH